MLSFLIVRLLVYQKRFENEFNVDNSSSTLERNRGQRAPISKKFFEYASMRIAELNTKANPTRNDNNAMGGNAATSLVWLPRERTGTPSLQTGTISNSSIAQRMQSPNTELYGLDANNWYRKGEELELICIIMKRPSIVLNRFWNMIRACGLAWE